MPQVRSQNIVGRWCPSAGATGFRLLDRSGRGNHGTLTGMDPATDWVVRGGKIALDFDGVNDHVVATQVHSTNSISISAWSRVSTGSTTFGYIVDLSTGSQVVAGIGTNHDATQVRWVCNDGSNLSICDLAVNNPANTMSHWVGTWNGSTAIFYLNGVQVASATSSRVLSTGAQNIYIARLLSADRYALGQIDDVIMWNTALTGSEVNHLYRLGRGYGVGPSAHRSRRAVAAGTNRRRRIICGGSC